MAKTLFDIPDDKICSIFDITYHLAQKSKNYAGQKHLWSEQKKIPLVKWWVVRLTVGYILLDFDWILLMQFTMMYYIKRLFQ